MPDLVVVDAIPITPPQPPPPPPPPPIPPEGPPVHDTSRRIYLALGGGLRDGDRAANWPLLRFVDALASPLGEIDDLVRDSTEGPGWSKALSLTRSDDLHYLAQFVGSDVPPGLTDAQAREYIASVEGQGRGTTAAMVSAARVHLTGERRVKVAERVGGEAYQIHFQTYGIETPDPSATEAALRRAKPAGLLLTYSVIEGATYDELGEHFETYDDLSTEFETYDDSKTWLPPE